MPLDAICLAALTSELNKSLIGGKIDKVLQPNREEIQLSIRSSNGNCRLLLSASSQNPRVHLTEISRENPQTPPMFCMFLRKHLTGGRFVSVTQPPLERVIIFEWMTTDEMGEASVKKLVCEIMGRHSNLILVGSDNRILDCLRRVDAEMSEKRQVLPGMFYHLPPAPEKLNPLNMKKDEVLELWCDKNPSQLGDKWLIENFLGICPLIAREMDFVGLPESFLTMLEDVKNEKFSPVLLCGNDGEYKDFSFRNIFQYNDLYKIESDFRSFSCLLDSFYTKRDMQIQMKQRSQGLSKYANNQRDRIVRKLALQSEELIASQNRDRFREVGDLLMANLHLAQKGMKSVSVLDFYDVEQSRVDIALDEDKSPQQNAAKYYKEFTKAKNAQISVAKQIEQANQDLAYWESVIEELTRITSDKELEEIREEIQPNHNNSANDANGNRRHGSKKMKTKPSAPLAFISSEGIPFYAGRNNKQNDELTMKMADKSDMWLHVQKQPGCHVIIDGSLGNIGENTLFEAAVIAAFYSSASKSPKVTVDYTFAKNVKKPPASKPGMVIYDKFKSLLVQPNGQLVESLMRKK